MIIDDEKMSFERMREEAVARMIMLGLDTRIYESFCFENKLLCSDNGQITEVPENILKELKAWENQYGNIVYHVIHADLIFNTYECLSVSCYREDWDFERDIMRDDWAMSHSINTTIPEFTESGSIKVSKENGTLRRVG